MVDYNNSPVVVKTECQPPLEGLTPYQLDAWTPGTPKPIVIQSIVEPFSQQGKHAYVHLSSKGWSDFEIVCDEGTPLLGDDNAPAPLAYLVAGVSFCLCTHITQFLKASTLKVNKIKVETRARYTVNVPPKGKLEEGWGRCESFENAILIDSDDDPDKIAKFAAQCKGACMALNTVINAVPESTSLILNGEQIEISEASSSPD